MEGKKLYRLDSPDKKLLGVCGGFAEYFGLDPTVVRVIWVLAFFLWGVGLLAYLICALIMPKKSDIYGPY